MTSWAGVRQGAPAGHWVLGGEPGCRAGAAGPLPDRVSRPQDAEPPLPPWRPGPSSRLSLLSVLSRDKHGRGSGARTGPRGRELLQGGPADSVLPGQLQAGLTGGSRQGEGRGRGARKHRGPGPPLRLPRGLPSYLRFTPHALCFLGTCRCCGDTCLSLNSQRPKPTCMSSPAPGRVQLPLSPPWTVQMSRRTSARFSGTPCTFVLGPLFRHRGLGSDQPVSPRPQVTHLLGPGPLFSPAVPPSLPRQCQLFWNLPPFIMKMGGSAPSVIRSSFWGPGRGKPHVW